MKEETICEYCGKSMKRTSYNSHVLRIHNRDLMPHSCESCNQRFPSKTTLDDHIKSKHLKVKDLICEKCNKTFATDFNLKKHVTYVHDKPRLVCEMCGKTFTTKASLNRHMINHTEGAKPFKCRFCDNQYAQKYRLECHEKEHSENPPVYQCSFCDKTLHNPETFRHHVARHKFPFCCTICYKRFKNEEEKRDHKCSGPKNGKCSLPKGYEENFTIKRLECNACGLVFHKISALRLHKSHFHADKFKCSICLELFDSEEDRESHSCKGTECLHRCDFCDRGYRLKGAMKAHRKIHTHNFKCFRCSKRFMDENLLKNHVCPKSDRKPKTMSRTISCSRCNLCNLDFKSYHEYVVHKKQHEVFQCPHCPKKCTSKKTLGGHIDYMHKQRVQMSKQHEKLEFNKITASPEITSVNNHDGIIAVDDMAASTHEGYLIIPQFSGNENPSNMGSLLPVSVMPIALVNNAQSSTQISYFSL